MKSAPHSAATLSVAAKLGTAITEARYEDMSPEVVERAKLNRTGFAGGSKT
jgi:hypothetical protein